MLCKGDKTEAEKHHPPLALSYKNSIIHRIVPNGWIQGGGTKYILCLSCFVIKAKSEYSPVDHILN